MQLLRRERRKSRTTFKGLAQNYRVSVWTAFQLCQRVAREWWNCRARSRDGSRRDCVPYHPLLSDRPI